MEMDRLMDNIVYVLGERNREIQRDTEREREREK